MSGSQTTRGGAGGAGASVKGSHNMLAAEIENSAGHDSLEMVADFGGGRMGANGT